MKELCFKENVWKEKKIEGIYLNVLINGGKNDESLFFCIFLLSIKKLKSTGKKRNKKVSFERGVRVIGWQNVKEKLLIKKWS